jgi:hypothetical protein
MSIFEAKKHFVGKQGKTARVFFNLGLVTVLHRAVEWSCRPVQVAFSGGRAMGEISIYEGVNELEGRKEAKINVKRLHYRSTEFTIDDHRR